MNPYGKIDNLSKFINEDFGRGFKYKDDKQSIKMAQMVFDEIIKSNYKNVIFIESGTAPLFKIITLLPEYKVSDINFIQLKIPRDLNFNLFDWFKLYLSKTELNQNVLINNHLLPRCNYLKNLCDKTNLDNLIQKKPFTIIDSINDNFDYNYNILKQFNKVLYGTKLSKFFNSKFLVFDEYINAGTIIRNFNLFAKLFNIKPDFKLSAFCMFLEKPNLVDKIAFTLYSKETELECYTNGAYPFENRIDLIGYYFYSADTFEKIYLDDLLNVLNEGKNCKAFYKTIKDYILKNDLLSKLKSNCVEEQVRNYIRIEDIARYIIKDLEFKLYGISKYYDFLDQVFEIYAPAWSPMPVKNHLDYWNAFEKLKCNIKYSESILRKYKKYRTFILNQILKKFSTYRINWLKRINKKLGEIYEYY